MSNLYRMYYTYLSEFSAAEGRRKDVSNMLPMVVLDPSDHEIQRPLPKRYTLSWKRQSLLITYIIIIHVLSMAACCATRLIS